MKFALFVVLSCLSICLGKQQRINKGDVINSRRIGTRKVDIQATGKILEDYEFSYPKDRASPDQIVGIQCINHLSEPVDVQMRGVYTNQANVHFKSDKGYLNNVSVTCHFFAEHQLQRGQTITNHGRVDGPEVGTREIHVQSSPGTYKEYSLRYPNPIIPGKRIVGIQHINLADPLNLDIKNMGTEQVFVNITSGHRHYDFIDHLHTKLRFLTEWED